MRGVKEEIFRALSRDPPATADEFLEEALKIEKATLSRSTIGQRRDGYLPSASAAGLDVQSLRDLIREIVREEVRAVLRPEEARHEPISIGAMIQEEVRQALHPSPTPTPAPDAPIPTYAAAVRRHLPAHNTSYANSWRATATQPAPTYSPVRQPVTRKTDVWRTADRRPLCYHCGEPNHVYRRCPYRRLGLPGFHPNAPRPERGTRPEAIEDYLRRQQTPFTAGSDPSPNSFRRSRSPARWRSPSPARRLSTSPRRLVSQSPNRGN